MVRISSTRPRPLAGRATPRDATRSVSNSAHLIACGFAFRCPPTQSGAKPQAIRNAVPPSNPLLRGNLRRNPPTTPICFLRWSASHASIEALRMARAAVHVDRSHAWPGKLAETAALPRRFRRLVSTRQRARSDTDQRAGFAVSSNSAHEAARQAIGKGFEFARAQAEVITRTLPKTANTQPLHQRGPAASAATSLRPMRKSRS